jgi:hypothetical protein
MLTLVTMAALALGLPDLKRKAPEPDPTPEPAPEPGIIMTDSLVGSFSDLGDALLTAKESARALGAVLVRYNEPKQIPPAELDALVVDALATADDFGWLMPSHAGTAQSKALMAGGFAAYHEDCPGWPRLTEPGMARRAAILRRRRRQERNLALKARGGLR